MKFYRIKQFIWGIESSFKKIDYSYIETYLNNNEIMMFNKLKKSDKHHCIRVCKDSVMLLKNNNIKMDEYRVGKIALLHDIGKSKYHINLIEKSLIVLLDKFTKGNLKKYDNIKQINIYYNHPKIGYEMLKTRNYDKELLEVVRYHHNKKKFKKNKIIDIISICDNKN
ncbi:HDIG domain-containing metalloprotein [Clostridium gasigenes]|uniref:HDIG domain-containing protein n=1 Tax=Clostridium gasigenes TaxID=94869 RepID=A0A1H0T1D7_9CLOT|nr:HDIG domain-containing metalloprotein [Clostridium gasigenes]MBB6623816.1 HDIG domain-containing protein [Clostridium gasigenes]MBU3090105.1 HDIG domain-containing protein [Clostridium gasigenes]MBU3134373.1 HDIG domain-containing protein [Clostridium gasigenes]NKF07904.1 HDIG domain-containing protein [Clostridium gasigenes]QSW20716.1 HDIG domain-containing protein [Clostridium gasigenes]